MKKILLIAVMLSVSVVSILWAVQASKKVEHIYEYPVDIVRVIDGDTFVCNIDMGLDVTLKKQKIRLLGCDAYEKRGATKELGLKAKAVAEDFLSTGTFVLITNGKRDSFGRVLGNVNNQNKVYLKDVLTSNSLTTGRYENEEK